MIRGGLVTLSVKDAEQSVRFYVETLGMKLVEQAPALTSAVIDAGEGFLLALHQAPAGGGGAGKGGGSVGFYPKVPIAEAIAIFENRGVTFDVKDDGPVIVAHFRDPDGNALYLCQPK